jgi:hypothetical protein
MGPMFSPAVLEFAFRPFQLLLAGVLLATQLYTKLPDQNILTWVPAAMLVLGCALRTIEGIPGVGDGVGVGVASVTSTLIAIVVLYGLWK